MPQFIYRDLDDTPTDITPYVKIVNRENPAEMQENAEERSVGTWELEIEDNGVLDLHAQRTFYVLEYDAPDPVVWVGQTGDKHSSREEWRDTTERVYKLQLDDLNTLLERRVVKNGDNADRGAETDVHRMRWLWSLGYIGTTDAWISTASPVDMDAVDYTGRMASEVIEDCMGQSGKNCFMFRDPDTTIFSVFYGDSSSTNAVLTSDLRISNVLSDVDSETTWAASHDSTLEEGASRLYSGIFANYDGGTVYRESLDTVNNFSHRDVVLSWPDVKTSAKANARAQRYLNTVNDEEDIITTSIVTDREHVNDAHAGYRIQARFSHFPNYADNFTWMRILNRAVTVMSPDKYLIKYTLSASAGDIAGDILIAVFHKGGADMTEPADLLGGWTRAFWTGDIAWAGQGPGPGGPTGLGMWYRQVVPGESATVLEFTTGGATTAGCWVFQVSGATLSGITSSSGNDITPYSLGSEVTVTSPSASTDSVWFGAFILQKVNYGQFTVMDRSLGTEVINANGNNDVGGCGDGDPSPPKVYIGYREVSSGTTSIGATFVCPGAGPFGYNGYGRGYGGLLLETTGGFSVSQTGFDNTTGGNIVVTLPSPP